ncbi:MAG: hypothetical protein WCX22_01875 [Methanoregula sp.]
MAVDLEEILNSKIAEAMKRENAASGQNAEKAQIPADPAPAQKNPRVITIDVDRAMKYGAIVIGVILVIVLVGASLVYIEANTYNAGRAAGIAELQAVIPTPTPTPIPTPTPVSYPTSLTFTVLSTSCWNTGSQAITFTGQALILPDAYICNSLNPQQSYTATVTGVSGTAYIVGSVTPLYQSAYEVSNYRPYWTWHNREYTPWVPSTGLGNPSIAYGSGNPYQ